MGGVWVPWSGGLALTVDHDGVVLDDVVREWVSCPGQPCTLSLSGRAGGRWTFGNNARASPAAPCSRAACTVIHHPDRVAVGDSWSPGIWVGAALERSQRRCRGAHGDWHWECGGAGLEL